jgi:sugar O-acyltransferase (sialic acid O-acetyltransferase NeuD family)
MTSPLAGLVILGFGGHARSIGDVALAAGISQLRFIDSAAKPGEQFMGQPVDSHMDGPLPAGWACFPASGDNAKRALQIADARQRQWALAILVAPTATIGAGATLAEGCFVAHHAHVGPLTILGEGVIINTGAIVDHDASVGAYTHVAIGAKIAGRGRIGEHCLIGAGATVIDGISIASHVTLGAGATAVQSIDIAGTYVGTPARRI